MIVKGFEIAVIEAKRFSKAGEKVNNVRVDHNSTVTQIAKVSDDVKDPPASSGRPWLR